ncbi:MAG: efflux RND transporter periplasmic adaptor subunit [Chromatiales bacterium]|nr:efflux RND transporter periplasmic adaptor subunit [Chromatiales bacterium]
MKKTQKFMILAALCITALLATILMQTRPQAIASKEDKTLTSVETVVAEERSIIPNYTLTGRLQPIKTSDLEFEVEGQIIARYVEPGTYVRQGQVLLAIDKDDYYDAYIQAQARRDNVSAQLKYDKELLKLTMENVALQRREVARVESLSSKQHVSPSVVESEKKQLVNFRSEQVRLEYSIRKAEIDLVLNNSLLNNAQRDLQRTSLSAPFSGTVNEIMVEIGDYVSRSKKVATLVDLSLYDLILNVSNSEVSTLELNSTVPVTIGNKNYQGTLVALQEDPDYETNTHKVKIRLSGNDLQAGATAQATLKGKRHERAISIPVTAVQYIDGQPFLFVVSDNNILENREVLLGMRLSDEIVVEQGITVGELVVARDIEKLNFNQEVIPTPLNPPNSLN